MHFNELIPKFFNGKNNKILINPIIISNKNENGNGITKSVIELNDVYHVDFRLDSLCYVDTDNIMKNVNSFSENHSTKLNILNNAKNKLKELNVKSLNKYLKKYKIDECLYNFFLKSKIDLFFKKNKYLELIFNYIRIDYKILENFNMAIYFENENNCQFKFLMDTVGLYKCMKLKFIINKKLKTENTELGNFSKDGIFKIMKKNNNYINYINNYDIFSFIFSNYVSKIVENKKVLSKYNNDINSIRSLSKQLLIMINGQLKSMDTYFAFLEGIFTDLNEMKIDNEECNDDYDSENNEMIMTKLLNKTIENKDIGLCYEYDLESDIYKVIYFENDINYEAFEECNERNLNNSFGNKKVIDNSKNEIEFNLKIKIKTEFEFILNNILTVEFKNELFCNDDSDTNDNYHNSTYINEDSHIFGNEYITNSAIDTGFNFNHKFKNGCNIIHKCMNENNHKSIFYIHHIMNELLIFIKILHKIICNVKNVNDIKEECYNYLTNGIYKTNDKIYNEINKNDDNLTNNEHLIGEDNSTIFTFKYKYLLLKMFELLLMVNNSNIENLSNESESKNINAKSEKMNEIVLQLLKALYEHILKIISGIDECLKSKQIHSIDLKTNTIPELYKLFLYKNKHYGIKNSKSELTNLFHYCNICDSYVADAPVNVTKINISKRNSENKNKKCNCLTIGKNFKQIMKNLIHSKLKSENEIKFKTNYQRRNIKMITNEVNSNIINESEYDGNPTERFIVYFKCLYFKISINYKREKFNFFNKKIIDTLKISTIKNPILNIKEDGFKNLKMKSIINKLSMNIEYMGNYDETVNHNKNNHYNSNFINEKKYEKSYHYIFKFLNREKTPENYEYMNYIKTVLRYNCFKNLNQKFINIFYNFELEKNYCITDEYMLNLIATNDKNAKPFECSKSKKSLFKTNSMVPLNRLTFDKSLICVHEKKDNIISRDFLNIENKQTMAKEVNEKYDTNKKRVNEEDCDNKMVTFWITGLTLLIIDDMSILCKNYELIENMLSKVEDKEAKKIELESIFNETNYQKQKISASKEELMNSNQILNTIKYYYRNQLNDIKKMNLYEMNANNKKNKNLKKIPKKDESIKPNKIDKNIFFTVNNDNTNEMKHENCNLYIHRSSFTKQFNHSDKKNQENYHRNTHICNTLGNIEYFSNFFIIDDNDDDYHHSKNEIPEFIQENSDNSIKHQIINNCSIIFKSFNKSSDTMKFNEKDENIKKNTYVDTLIEKLESEKLNNTIHANYKKSVFPKDLIMMQILKNKNYSNVKMENKILSRSYTQLESFKILNESKKLPFKYLIILLNVCSPIYLNVEKELNIRNDKKIDAKNSNNNLISQNIFKNIMNDLKIIGVSQKFKFLLLNNLLLSNKYLMNNNYMKTIKYNIDRNENFIEYIINYLNNDEDLVENFLNLKIFDSKYMLNLSELNKKEVNNEFSKESIDIFKNRKFSMMNVLENFELFKMIKTKNQINIPIVNWCESI
jgi:hypothetical protein